MQTSSKVNQLMSDVEELLAELGDHPDPDIDALRTRVHAAIGAARQAMAPEGAPVLARVGRFVTATDDYINNYPRLAFASGVLVAGLVGYLVGVTGRSQSS